MNSVRHLLILLLSVVLLACGGGGGGGGGGGSDGGSNNTGSTPDDTGGGDNTGENGGDDTGTTPPFEIDDIPLFPIGMGTAEVTLTLARLSADAFLAQEAAGFINLEENCADGGERSLIFFDVDNSTDLSVGDRVELSFDNCSGSAVVGLANGTIRLELDSIIEPANPSARTLVFNETFVDFILIDEGGQSTTIEGGFQLQFDDNELSGDTLTIAVNSGSLDYGFPGGDSVSVMPGSQLQKTLDLDSDIYLFSFDQILDASLSGETFTLYADTFGGDVTVAGSFSGDLPGFPAVGAARFYVPGVGSQCLLTIGSDSSPLAEPDRPLLRLLEGGDACMMSGTDAALIYWLNIVAGVLFDDVDNYDLRN